jgi:hypothetical protein
MRNLICLERFIASFTLLAFQNLKKKVTAEVLFHGHGNSPRGAPTLRNE